MIRSLYVAVRERRWNRDRQQRVEMMLRRERTSRLRPENRFEAMAIQLEEIWALPEAREPRY